MKTHILIVITTLFFTVNCNKSKRNSKKIDDNKWRAVELSVNGSNESELPTFKFNDCDIHKEACKGWWYLGEDGHAETAWQFRNNGKEFEISNQADHAHNIEDVKAADQCIAFSGIYKVIKCNRNYMEFESNNTFKYPNKKAVLKLERIK
jgi:hypothetical protein